MVKPQMTYQQYVKARSAQMKAQGVNLTGAERMKQIAHEWRSKAKGLAMAGGSFSDVVKHGSSVNLNKEMVGKGAKLNKVKKLAVKFGIPLAVASALFLAGENKGLVMGGKPDMRNFQEFEMVDEENPTPYMEEEKITGLGLKKGKKVMKGKKLNKKQMKDMMAGEGFFDFITDIQDGIKGVFGNPQSVGDLAGTVANTGSTVAGALPFIL